jgi:hypothetical protein
VIHKGGLNVMVKLQYQEIRPALGTIRERELAFSHFSGCATHRGHRW